MKLVTFSHRHLAILGLTATVACGGGRSPGVSPAQLAAPASAEAAVDQFLAAANAADLDQMALLWGDERGSVAQTGAMPQEQRRQRLAIMQRLLTSDSHQVTATDVSRPGRRILTVAMSQGTRRFSVPFTVVPLRGGGWIVNDIGLDAAMPQAPTRTRN